MSAAGTTARVRREQRRAALGASLHAAVDRIGMSHGEAAALIGVDRSTFDRWADAHDALSISVADLAALPLEVRRALITEHVAPEHDLVERGAAASDLGCDLAHVRAVVREAAQATDVGLDAIADGHITADEGAMLVAHSDRLIAAAQRLRALGGRVMRARAITVQSACRAVGR